MHLWLYSAFMDHFEHWIDINLESNPGWAAAADPWLSEGLVDRGG